MVAYFRDMASQAIVQADGMIVESSGQRVTAVFNDPLSQPNHPQLAVNAALILQKEIKTYHRSFSTYDHPHRYMHFGFGVFSGRALVGYGQIGEERRYTALGDVVEIAMRLADSATSDQIVVGDITYNEISEHFITERQAPISVRNRVEPVAVYAVLQQIQDTIRFPETVV